MTVFCWNIRGLNGHSKQRAINQWISANRLYIGGLLETRVQDANLGAVLQRTLPGWRYESNHSEIAENGRIIVVWNPAVSVIIYKKSDQFILCGVVDPISNNSYTICFVYARNLVVERRPLWTDLISLASNPLLSNSPWLVMGDLNQVLSSDELYSMLPSWFSIQGMSDLRDCISASSLFHLPSRGCRLTWSNHQTINPIARKLDRALSNEAWLESFPHSSALFDVPGCLDHSPCLVSFSEQVVHRKCPFKFFTFVTTHPDYPRLISEAWAAGASTDSDMDNPPLLLTLYQKLSSAKSCCKSINKYSFGNIQTRTKEALDKLELIQNQLFSSPTQALFEEEKLARESWIFYSAAEETFFKLKARVKWLDTGDANTAFFHKSVKANISRNSIYYLRDNAGDRVTDSVQLKEMITHYYKSLLGCSNRSVVPYTVTHIKRLHPFRCSSSLAAQLVAIPSAAEIKEIVFDLPQSKAPGPDGFPVEFFIHSWELVGSDLIRAVRDFFSSSCSLHKYNATIITLIPKVTGADTLTDFRPISCCNTVYKIIARLLASRLKLFLSDAVQENQVGFIEGRLLCENILLATELVADFNKQGDTTRGCLQIDLSKAYDKLDWNFILNILRAFELPVIFINWIRECITSTSFSISLNGELVGYFPGKKGLRQGDPISSSLFALAMDILAKDLDKAATTGLFHPHPQCIDPLVTHLSFADDVLVFFDGSEQSLEGILLVLDRFYLTSGLELNLRKSALFLDGDNLSSARLLSSRFGLIQGSLPVRYLGLPLLPHKLRPCDYQPLLDKVTDRISGWTVRHLSFAGRLQLIQSVLYGIINFWATTFPLPKSCLLALERICSAFLWSGAPNSARGAKVSWDSVCTPKEAGGLGLRRLEAWNTVFSLKLIWLLFTKSGSLWVSWVHKVLIRGRLFWEADFGSAGSWIWKRLIKLRSIARPFFSCQIGSGSLALFWHDDWTTLGPLISLTGANGPRVTGIARMATVSQAVSNGVWRLPNGRNPLVALVRACLPTQAPDTSSLEQDYFLWRNSFNQPPGQFSSTLTWTKLNPVNVIVPWFGSVWFSESIPKHAFLLWVVLRDRLHTRDKLRSWGIPVPSICLLCNLGEETKEHLFFDCTYATQVWNAFFTHHSLTPPVLFQDIVTWVCGASHNHKLNIICKLILQSTVYAIWKERNSRLHDGGSKPTTQVIREMNQLIRSKLAGLDRRPILSVSASPTQPGQTYLSTWFTYIQVAPSLSSLLIS